MHEVSPGSPPSSSEQNEAITGPDGSRPESPPPFFPSAFSAYPTGRCRGPARRDSMHDPGAGVGVVLFMNGTCSRFTLPLQMGRGVME